MAHGRHIKVLGRGTPSRMGDVKTVETMLVDLIDVLGMRILDKAHMYEVETEISKLGVEPFEDEGGVTGVCVLSTSHCSIHTWPLRPFFVMDVFSCRDFDGRSSLLCGSGRNLVPLMRRSQASRLPPAKIHDHAHLRGIRW